MNAFRAIYHANPGDAHAAEAVAQVAELLAEQGREFGDTKSLHDAAGQYEYLAKAYPDGALAPQALEKALALLGPQDAAEGAKVRAELAGDYPQDARGDVAGTPTSQRRDVGHPEVAARQRSVAVRPGSESPDPAHPEVNAGGSEGRSGVVADTPTAQRREVGGADLQTAEPVGPLAVVTGIRHWSTASYTRVAIDLNVAPGEEVKYAAARVENPDRIFFDLEHARLAPELVGKSFNVTDDGFLERVRAAQFSDHVTRVVLDVHQVAEYSAFLLPNPYRLIIDIHGRQEKLEKQEVGSRNQEVASAAEPAATGPSASRAVEMSSLPPMPVTDGSASFGLPARGAERESAAKTVAEPRVVISSRPTAARPVPNTVMKSSADMGSEVAAVSEQPGMVEATRRPTSKPIAETSRVDASSATHYAPRSRRKAAASDGSDGVAAAPLSDDEPPQRAGERSLGTPVAVARMGRRGYVAGSPATAALPTADGETSLMRALGLKIGRIVIDAGHGGHDSGTLGAGGIEEKDVVLDVALRLGKLLHDRLGAEIVYTRADDTFIPLETRTAIANKAQADLFISIHANSSTDESARGVEVYYLNFTSDPEAMKVASRENAVSTESVHELSDLVKKIALKDKIDESKELASDVDASLYAGLRKGNPEMRNRGVKKAPFVVLIGANMPSILAEISFVTNPDDAAKLETAAYRERVAESLYKGIARYAEGINGERPRERTVEQAAR
jgi:N-acetylmuramoyl-L-alanine amidase